MGYREELFKGHAVGISWPTIADGCNLNREATIAIRHLYLIRLKMFGVGELGFLEFIFQKRKFLLHFYKNQSKFHGY